MRVLMLDTLKEEELDEIEAVRRIHARVAVEAPLGTNVETSTAQESAVLDRSANTMTKPRPQPRPPAPPREKRGRRKH